MVVTRIDKVGRSGVLGPAEAPVVGDMGPLAFLARFGRDEHYAGRSLGAVDGA